MSANQDIQKYKESLKLAWGYNDYNDWPIKFNSIMHLFVTEFTREYLEDFSQLLYQGFSLAEIGHAFKNPDRIYRNINFIIQGMKRLHMSIAQQQAWTVRLLETVRQMKYGSIFNEDGKHIIFTPSQVADCMKKAEFTLPSQNDAHFLQQLCGALWAYSEALYFRVHDIPKSIHGPYELDKKETDAFLLIRDYSELKALGIWNHKQIPMHSLQILTLYQNELQISVDSFNHVYNSKGNYKDSLLAYQILKDGQPVMLQETEELIPIMRKLILDVMHWSSECNWRQIANRYADIYWYRKKPLCDLLKKDWRVPQKVRENIESGDVNEKRDPNLSPESIDRLIYTMI